MGFVDVEKGLGFGDGMIETEIDAA
jgi:hypothetical protein